MHAATPTNIIPSQTRSDGVTGSGGAPEGIRTPNLLIRMAPMLTGVAWC
jgi:hypothetical protein